MTKQQERDLIAAFTGPVTRLPPAPAVGTLKIEQNTVGVVYDQQQRGFQVSRERGIAASRRLRGL